MIFVYLIDANIFLEILLDQPKKDQCAALFYKLASGEISAIVTDFVVDSIVVKLEHRKRTPIEIKRFLQNLNSFKGLKVYSVSLAEKIAAIDLMQQYKLDFDDSLQAQAAMSNNVSEIISFDGDFDSVKELTRLEPIEALKRLK